MGRPLIQGERKGPHLHYHLPSAWERRMLGLSNKQGTRVERGSKEWV